MIERESCVAPAAATSADAFLFFIIILILKRMEAAIVGDELNKQSLI